MGGKPGGNAQATFQDSKLLRTALCDAVDLDDHLGLSLGFSIGNPHNSYASAVL
jgi:hypothetical protein